MNEAAAWALAVAGMSALVIWVIRPLLGPLLSVPDPANGELDRLIEEKQAIYRSMIDLDFDHRLGKVSDDDHAHLRRQNESEAISILRQIDRAATKNELADTLESEIAAARRRLSSS